MMRRATITVVTLALAGAIAAPSFADETTSSLPLLVSGDVASECRLSPAAEGPGDANVRFSSVAGGSQVTVAMFVDPTTARTRSSTGAVQFQITCTGPHTLKVTSGSGGMVNGTTSVTGQGFTNRADYTLAAQWNGASRSVTTSGAAASLDLSQTNGAQGALTVTVSIPPGQGPLVAGAYQDTITVDLSAN